MREHLAESFGPSRPKGLPTGLYVPGSCLGRYHTDRQPGAALQNTAMCPAAAPGVRAASAGGRSHSTHDTVISPGPHSCPFWHRSG